MSRELRFGVAGFAFRPFCLLFLFCIFGCLGFQSLPRPTLRIRSIGCEKAPRRPKNVWLCFAHVSYSLNSLRGGYIGDYIGDCSGGYEGGY